jgi:parallel beta-helix repeat protein
MGDINELMSSLKRLLSFLIIALFCLSIHPQKSPLVNVRAEANLGLTRVGKAVNFLVNSQFNASLGLCRGAPEVAPNTYWLVSDNLWAWKALKMTNESGLSNAAEAGRIANLIEAKLKEKAIIHNLSTNAEGLPISFMHDAVIGDVIPTPNRMCNVLTLQNNDYTVKTEICNGTIMSDWQGYADRLLFMALSHHWQGNDTGANQYLEVAEGMWNGISINDTATKVDGFYTTYKLALLLYTSKILGQRLSFEFELVKRIWSLQRESDCGIITNYSANGTALGDANTETTSIVIIAILKARLGVFAFYYPWYGPPNSWDHITHHPLLGLYDSNNDAIIEQHINMAKEAGIDGFIVSWWGINHFTDNALVHIKNACEQNDFKFTFYYENTSSINQTVNDIMYILDNYANSSAWYRVDNRPVIYIYVRARNNLNPQAWKIDGNSAHWSLCEDVREPPKYGVFVIEPYEDGIGYIESVNAIFLPPNETYSLKAGISDMRNDCNCSDVGFRIKINGTDGWKILNESIVNFDDCWLDRSYNVSNCAGQNVSIRVESYAGGEENWCSEWAAVDYFYIENSKGEIVSPEPFFDNGWKAVVEESRGNGVNPYFIMDFTNYEENIQDFAEYFLNFTDGLHIYGPCGFSASLSKVFEVYNQASDAAHSKNKIFVATVMPGYNDTNCPGRRGYVVDRQNGTYYTSFWSIATACFPDGYVITSFNEWYEGTEIEPSLEYGYQYINLTRSRPTVWTVDDDEPADFSTIQEAINTASPGDIVYVRNGTYYENLFINKTVSLVGEDLETTIIDGSKSNVTFNPVVHVFGEDAKNVSICNLTIRGSDNAWGLYITFHANAWIEKNIITNNSGGIVADFSDSNTFVNNTIVDNKFEGILFFYSSGNIMRNNTISGNNYNFGISESSFNHDINTSNLVNGKPIYFFKNQSDLVINPHSFSSVGYLALINCTNITVENLTLTNNYNGLLLVETKNSTLRNNVFKNNSRGIDIIDSSNNTIQGNNVTDSTWLGISLAHSPNNRFRENNLVGNQLNFKVSGDSLSDFLQDIDLSSTVDGKFMRYLINCTDLVVNPSTFDNTGYIALVNCYNITVENFSLENSELLVAFTQNSSIIGNTITGGGIELTYSSFVNSTGNIIADGESGVSIHHSNNNTVAKNSIVQNKDHGIYLLASSYNTIFFNDVKDCRIGVELRESSNNNTVFGNNITDNEYYGFLLCYSSYNKIFHSNFINNGWQAICSQYPLPLCLNDWDNGYPSGGNYWSDYNGTDLYSGTRPQSENGSDGIGDTFYNSYGAVDRYPLMQPIKTFEAGVWEGETCNMGIISNSTVSKFKLNETARTISFNVTGDEGAAGFCRIIIPNIIVQGLWNNSYSVLVNGGPWLFRNWTDTEDTYIYINYTHSEHEITIIPEFPKATILTILIVITTFVAVATKKQNKSNVTKSRRNLVRNRFA